MLKAKPIKVFRLAGRNVLSCIVTTGNPNAFIGKEFAFSTQKGVKKRIQIKGLSTASNIPDNEYDYWFTGDDLRTEEIDPSALLSEIPQ